MRSTRSILAVILGFLLFVPGIDAKITGVFQGKIIKASARYLYVQGKTGFVRKVDVATASVEYDEDFPARGRLKKPSDALKVSAHVLVRAEQRKGKWKASEVLILKPIADAPRATESGLAARLKN